MRNRRMLPPSVASTVCPFGNVTRNVALGRTSVTVPSSCIASCFAIPPIRLGRGTWVLQKLWALSLWPLSLTPNSAKPRARSQSPKRVVLDLRNVLRSRSLLPLDDVELDAIAFSEGLEAVALNRRVMDEAILAAAIGGDEAETF